MKDNIRKKDNRGSAPLPKEVFNKGDGTYSDDVARDKDALKEKMNKNMAKNGGKPKNNK